MPTAADRLPDFAIVLAPTEGLRDWRNPPPGLVAVRPVLAVDRRGCWRWCSHEILIAAEAIAYLPVMAEGATPAQRTTAITYLREGMAALRPDREGIDYPVPADRVVAERKGAHGDIATFTPAYPVLLNRWRPYGSAPSWPAVRRWGRGPRTYARLVRLAAAV